MNVTAVYTSTSVLFLCIDEIVKVVVILVSDNGSDSDMTLLVRKF